MLSTKKELLRNDVATGVFAASFFANNGYTASVDTKNCYYGECAVTTNVGSATAKDFEEFTNGTVAKLLGGLSHKASSIRYLLLTLLTIPKWMQP